MLFEPSFFFFFLSPSLILSLCLPSSPHFHKNTPSTEHLRRSCDGTRIRHRKCCCAPLELQRYGYPARRVPKSNNTMHKKLGTRGGGNTKYREKNDESSAKAKKQAAANSTRHRKSQTKKETGNSCQKKKLSAKSCLSSFFFFSVCVCVCVILSLQCDMSGNISLCSPHTQQTQQTMNGRGECLLDACECITSVKKKKRDGRCFFAFLFEYVASARSLLVLCFFLLLVHLIHFILFSVLLFFFFSQVCAEKHCSGS